MNFEADAAKLRAETMERITVGIGLLSQALNGLSGVLHHAAQALDALIEQLIPDDISGLDDQDAELDEDPEDMEGEEDGYYVPPSPATTTEEHTDLISPLPGQEPPYGTSPIPPVNP